MRTLEVYIRPNPEDPTWDDYILRVDGRDTAMTSIPRRSSREEKKRVAEQLHTQWMEREKRHAQ